MLQHKTAPLQEPPTYLNREEKVKLIQFWKKEGLLKRSRSAQNLVSSQRFDLNGARESFYSDIPRQIAGNLVRLRIQTQWGVAFLMFCAAGAELASGRQEFQFCREKLQAAGGGWRRRGAAAIASEVDLKDSVPYVEVGGIIQSSVPRPN